MNLMKIERTYFPGGTNGALFYKDEPICKTIELPWKDNLPGISCIPEGKYMLLIRSSARFGVHMYLSDVPGRELILIHPANNALKQLKGCIAPVTTILGEGRGTASRKAFDKLMDTVIDDLESPKPMYLIITS